VSRLESVEDDARISNIVPLPWCRGRYDAMHKLCQIKHVYENLRVTFEGRSLSNILTFVDFSYIKHNDFCCFKNGLWCHLVSKFDVTPITESRNSGNCRVSMRLGSYIRLQSTYAAKSTDWCLISSFCCTLYIWLGACCTCMWFWALVDMGGPTALAYPERGRGLKGFNPYWIFRIFLNSVCEIYCPSSAPIGPYALNPNFLQINVKNCS